jgi:hypothetical protein
MKKILLIVVIAILCPCLHGQSYPQHSAGVRIAGGSYGHANDRSGARLILGGEACVYCEGTRALFLEYSHFFPPSSDAYDNADLVAAGIRLQTRQKTRFFFDVGIAAGNSRMRSTSTSTVGAALGVGLQVSVGEHFYLSPFFRTYPMNRSYISGSFGTGLGWRF